MQYRMAALASLLLMLCACFDAGAADIRLTLDNDIQLVLHDDFTWSCGSEQDREQLADMTITLGNGSVVHVAGDGTWSFLSADGSGGEEAPDGLTVLYHTGFARSTDAIVVGKHARRLAMDGLVERVRAGTGTDLGDDDLRACIEGMEKRVERKEKCAGGTCEVRITITLEKDAIEGIKECIALSKRLEKRQHEIEKDSVSN